MGQHPLLALLLGIVSLTQSARASERFGETRNVIGQLTQDFTAHDLNLDGRPEIERLRRLKESGTFPYECQGTGDGLVLVLVEERLLSPLRDAPDLRPALRQYVADIAASGPDALLLMLGVYAGPVHQDGRTVLAMREFFRAVHKRIPDFRGAVLVGNFPDAMLVRQYFWHKRTPLALNAKKPGERKFEEPVEYWRTRAENIAMKAEIVLCDLDGNWEDCYHEAREELPYAIAAFPEGAEKMAGVTGDIETGTDAFEDFFFLDDGRWKTEDAGDGKLKFESLGERNSECSEPDAESPNPMATPEISVSRINAYHAAVNPDPAVVDKDGMSLLDDDGKPRTLTFPSKDDVPFERGFWMPDPKLERKLLVEYFERNHRYRTGAYNEHRRPASITTEWGSSMGPMKKAFSEWAEFDEEGYDIRGKETDLLACVRWLKRPALLRVLKAHSDPWGANFAKTKDLDALYEEVGGTLWNWNRKGNQLVPSLEGSRQKIDFAVHRSLYENGVLPDSANMFLLTGCDSISPANAETKPFSDPAYGHWQGVECLTMYCNGLVAMARSKVFNDEPREFFKVLGEGGSWGDAWRRYYELEANDARLNTLEQGIRRKKAYFWSVIGDWTLTMFPEGTQRPS